MHSRPMPEDSGILGYKDTTLRVVKIPPPTTSVFVSRSLATCNVHIFKQYGNDALALRQE